MYFTDEDLKFTAKKIPTATKAEKEQASEKDHKSKPHTK